MGNVSQRAVWSVAVTAMGIAVSACGTTQSPRIAVVAPGSGKPVVRGGAMNNAAAPDLLQLAAGEVESSRYRIIHVLFGQIGGLTISVQTGSTPTARILRGQAEGSGALLGFGRREQRIKSEVDTAAGRTLRYSAYRHLPDREFTDVAVQDSPGVVRIVRQRSGKPDEPAVFHGQAPVLDPLGALLRLRAGATSPGAGSEQTWAMLDGQAHSRVTFTERKQAESVAIGTQSYRTRVYDAVSRPFSWAHQPIPDREPKRFTIWITDDERRIPVLLTANSALGSVRVELASVKRGPASPVAPALARR